MNAHPKIAETSVRLNIGHVEAEQILRGMASTDPAAAKAVAEIDRGREETRAAGLRRIQGMAKALGWAREESARITNLMAKNPAMLTWLSRRVHLTIAGEKPIADHE